MHPFNRAAELRDESARLKAECRERMARLKATVVATVEILNQGGGVDLMGRRRLTAEEMRRAMRRVNHR